MDQKDALNKQESIKRVSKQRADGQKSGLAGEFFVAAELLKRGLQTSLTLGNAKSIDLFAINDLDKRFTIQVKALRSPNLFSHRFGARPGCLLLRFCGAKQAGHSAGLLHRAGV
jgi:hypothetical protein